MDGGTLDSFAPSHWFIFSFDANDDPSTLDY